MGYYVIFDRRRENPSVFLNSYTGVTPNGGLKLEEDIKAMLRKQKEHIDKLERTVEKLEYRVSASEKFIEKTSRSLDKMSSSITKNHWLTILILVGIVLLLGTE